MYKTTNMKYTIEHSILEGMYVAPAFVINLLPNKNLFIYLLFCKTLILFAATLSSFIYKERLHV